MHRYRRHLRLKSGKGEGVRSENCRTLPPGKIALLVTSTPPDAGVTRLIPHWMGARRMVSYLLLPRRPDVAPRFRKTLGDCRAQRRLVLGKIVPDACVNSVHYSPRICRRGDGLALVHDIIPPDRRVTPDSR
jgi:hypothetical protein